jgi:hypothetical protein
MSIIDYSKYNYVNIVNIKTIKHSEKILLINFVENTEKTDFITNVRICRVVNDGPIISTFNNNIAPFINVDYILFSFGCLHKRISNNQILIKNVNKNIPLSKQLISDWDRTVYGELYIKSPYMIENAFVQYIVRAPKDDLLEEIKNKKKFPSLFQLCLYKLNSKDLVKYNQMSKDFVLSY